MSSVIFLVKIGCPAKGVKVHNATESYLVFMLYFVLIICGFSFLPRNGKPIIYTNQLCFGRSFKVLYNNFLPLHASHSILLYNFVVIGC